LHGDGIRRARDADAPLLAAGYATGRTSSSHPLFQRTGPDRYRLITDPDA